MTPTRTFPAVAAFALLFAGGAAFAADYSTPTAPAKPAASAQKSAAVKTTAPRTPESIECSKEADAKGLHGAARKSFRASCKTSLKHGKPVPDAKT